MAPLYWLLFVGLTFHLRASAERICLPDAIPTENLQNVTLDGVSMPIGLGTVDWASGYIASEILGILLSEVMGYAIAFEYGGSSLAVLNLVQGCPTSTDNYTQCTLPSRNHIALEIWEHQTKLPNFLNLLADIKREFGEEQAIISLGSVGFEGYEGLFVMETAMVECQNAFGLHLQYYGNYNTTWFRPDMCTAHISDIDASLLYTYEESVDIGAPTAGQQYFNATGDSDGVELRNGALHYKSYNSVWWLAPSCRSDPTRCVPVVTAGLGWGIYIMTQQATAYDMPLAFATARTYGNYVSINRQVDSTAYYWSPDSTFGSQSPLAVTLPAYNDAEYREGIYRTMSSKTEIQKWAVPGIAAVADRAFGLMRNFEISTSEMLTLVKNYLDLAGPAGPDAWQTACNWITSNTEIWSTWVPDKTVCPEGQGLADSNGELVEDRNLAVDCATCPAGRASVKSAGTRVCTQCSAGSFQNTLGTTECKLCEPGSVAASRGAIHCDPCGLGQYANSAGMSECFSCGNGTNQENMWTTSREREADGVTTVILVEGADSESFCQCKEGSFLWQGLCQTCIEGSLCPGNSRLSLSPGYFSTAEDPGSVFRCSNAFACPGGAAGTCQAGRDVDSVACYNCLSGKKPMGDGSCEDCGAGDYSVLAFLAAAVVVAVFLLYVFLIKDQGKRPTQFLIVILAATQFLTVLQMLAVVGRFEIDWREPFTSLLVVIEIVSFDLEMLNLGCAAKLSPVVSFLSRCLFVPILGGITLVVHFIYLLVKREKNWHWDRCWRTMGTIAMVFFIILFSLILAPFQCEKHPNGSWTIRRYGTVFCNGQGDQLLMFVVGGLACLIPVAFLSICTWAILVKLPISLAQSDTKFFEACSFLIKRFRPGTEIFSVIFLIRNGMVVMTPLVFSKSGRLVMMSLILYGNIIMVAFFQPWRFMICNLLDLLLLMGMLVVLDMGSVAIEDTNPETTILIVMIFMVLMLLAVLATLGFGLYKFLEQKYRKQFRFFLCHQKNAAGSMARLLKMELERVLPGTKTFIDCDDLNDLTRLFSYVGQDTQTLLVMGSPFILTRKWCVGEMVTARANQVNTIILTWPDFKMPDEKYITQYPEMVPDIDQLSKFGIGLDEVNETLRWLSTLETVELPEKIQPASSMRLAHDLAKVGMAKVTQQRSIAVKASTAKGDTNCPILADPRNTEAMACAMVLSAMLMPRLLGTHVSSPSIVEEDEKIAPSATHSLLLCSENCFKSLQIQNWILQVGALSSCSMIPVITEESFAIPGDALFSELESNSMIDDANRYVLAIRALFQEIAVVFVPQNYSSTHEDLELRAKQAVMRLRANPQALSEKIKLLDASDMDERDRQAGRKSIAVFAKDFRPPSEEEEDEDDEEPDKAMNASDSTAPDNGSEEPLEKQSF